MGSGIYHHYPTCSLNISKRRQTTSLSGVTGVYSVSVLSYLLRIPACLPQALFVYTVWRVGSGFSLQTRGAQSSLDSCLNGAYWQNQRRIDLYSMVLDVAAIAVVWEPKIALSKYYRYIQVCKLSTQREDSLANMLNCCCGY